MGIILKIKKNLKRLFSLSKNINSLSENINDICLKILPTVTCIDIGASYYPHPAWEVFRRSSLTTWIACDPCSENLNYIQNWSWPSSIIQVPLGLSQYGGFQKLYVTSVDSGSSLLPPEIDKWKEYRTKMDYFFPLTEMQVNTITLTELIQQQKLENTPFLIKLDTQGTELSILQGLEASIIKQNLLAIEIEVTLQAKPSMKGSAHFYEVQEFLEDLGFELAYLKPIEGILPTFNHRLQGRSILNECDAVFIVRPDLASTKLIEYQLVLIGVYISYHLYGEALHLCKKLIKHTDLDISLKKYLSKLILNIE
ncbi:MAG: FkbM family methyltransferase [Cyanobacteria bacterium]|nr:FkbM family methyltransferase [Cyanobacteriota bacterium]